MRLVFSNLHFPFLSVISLLISYLTRLLSTQVTYHLTSLIFFVQRVACTRSGFTPSLCLSLTGFNQFCFYSLIWSGLALALITFLCTLNAIRYRAVLLFAPLFPPSSVSVLPLPQAWCLPAVLACVPYSVLFNDFFRVASVSFLLFLESVMVSASAVPLLHTFCSPSALMLLFISWVGASESHYRTHYFIRGCCVSS